MVSWTTFNQSFQNWDNHKIDLVILISLDDICDRPLSNAFKLESYVVATSWVKILGTKIATASIE